MPFDWNKHLRETAEWLVTMSEVAGAQGHAILRRDEKLADSMYAGLKEQIQAVRRERSSSTSPAPPSERADPLPGAPSADT